MALRQFDVLVRIRKLQENLQAQVLATTRRKIGVAQEQRDGVLNQQRAILTEAGRRMRQYFDPREVRIFYQFERHLKKLADAMDADIARLRRISEQQRRDLEQAMRRRRMVEKLRDYMFEDSQSAARKEDQKRVDESATNAAARRLEINGGQAVS